MLQTLHYFKPQNGKLTAIILANTQKTSVTKALKTFKPWLAERADIAAEIDTPSLTREKAKQLPKADLAIVLGGDGTMLAQARAMIGHGAALLGINFGKVGFLAEFSIESIEKHWDDLINGRCRVSNRLMLEVSIFDQSTPEWGGAENSLPEPVFKTVAMNDIVVTAGPPYRMVEIELAIEPRQSHTSATTFSSDGLIVSTPSGSTAYNLAAGGPIISPGIDGICVSAICPQSLAFRPIVYNAEAETWLTMKRANEGTTLVIDGQESWNLSANQQILITKHSQAVQLVHNPEFNYWKMLAHKMHWAARPRGRFDN